MNAKRPAEDEVPLQKRTRIKLASPSPERTSASDTESIHSYQGYKTELANDTSDTSTSSALHTEYEIAKPEKQKPKFYLSDDSFEQEDLEDRVLNAVSSDSLENALLGDTSEENSTSPTSNSDVDPGLPRNDYLDFEKCLLCKTTQKNISYPYCAACFTWKKNLFPSRPKKRKRGEAQCNILSKGDCILDLKDNKDKNKNKNKNNCVEVNTKSNLSHGLFDDSGVGSADAAQSEDTVDGPSQPSTSSSSSTSTSTSTTNVKSSETCSVCFLKPENGLFVHLNTAHRYGCYSCAKEIWYQNGGCPLCRRKVFKVTKLYL